MRRAGADIESAGLDDLSSFAFLDSDLADFGELRAELRGKACGHVLHKQYCARKILGDVWDEFHQRGWTASGSGNHHYREFPVDGAVRTNRLLRLLHIGK